MAATGRPTFLVLPNGTIAMTNALKRISTGLVLTVGLVASQASAAVLLSDGFEYADQNSYEAVWPPVVAANGAGVLTQQTGASTGKFITIGSTPSVARAERIVAESGAATAANVVTFSYSFFDSNATAAPYRQFANLQDSATGTGSGQLISIGLNNNLTSSAEGGNFYMARVLGFNGTGSPFFKLNDNASLTRSTGWHTLSAVIDAANVKFYVDGSLAETTAFAVASTVSYERVRIGSGLTSGNTAGYDNVVFGTNIPEPTVLASLAAGAALLRRRRR